MTMYRAPREGEVRDVLLNLNNLQLRRVFFTQLENPLWVEPLAELGEFANPPEPVVGDDGQERELPWPEIDYLVRVAPLAPGAVTDVAVKIAASGNSWVRRGLVSIASRVPAEYAAPLAKAFLKWGRSELGGRVDPTVLTSVIVTLFEGGFEDLGRRLASMIFRPRKLEIDGSRSRPDVVIDDYWYEELLPKVTASMGPRRVEFLIRWLEDHQRFADRLPKEPSLDLSHFDRHDIEAGDDFSDRVLEALIDAVRDAAVDGMFDDPEMTVALLTASGQTLSLRICLYALAVALERAPDDARFASVAAGLVPLPQLGWMGFLVEFPKFLRALSAARGPDAIAGIRGTLDAGPFGDAELFAERWTSTDKSDEENKDDRVEYAAMWRHRILSAIGGDALPNDLSEELVELDERFGVFDEPTRLFSVSAWEGPEAPLDTEAITALDRDALLTYLETWHPSPESLRGPSHEGLGRTIVGVVAASPMKFENAEARVLRLRPTYLRAVLSGWREALKRPEPFPWTAVGVVVAGALSRPVESDFAVEGGRFDDDDDYRGVRRAALWLSVAMLEPREGERRAPTPTVDLIATTLLAAADDPAIVDDYTDDRSGGMDPLTLSLNSDLAVAIRGLTQTLAFADLTDRAVVLERLAREARTEDRPGAVAAVFGEAIARLMNFAEVWFAENVAVLFGSAEEMTRQQQIAFSTAIATHHPHASILEALRDPFAHAIALGEDLAMGWDVRRSALELAGDWIVTEMIGGKIGFEDPLAVAFFNSAPVPIRAHVLGRIGWALMRADAVPEDVLNRAQELWESRYDAVVARSVDPAELAEFSWWVRSDKFPTDWWLPLLRQVTLLNPGLESRGMMGEQIAKVAPLRPADALAVVENLATVDGDLGMLRGYDLVERAIPAVIAAALDSGDEEVVKNGRRFMNELGMRGMIDLERRVEALRLS